MSKPEDIVSAQVAWARGWRAAFYARDESVQDKDHACPYADDLLADEWQAGRRDGLAAMALVRDACQ